MTVEAVLPETPDNYTKCRVVKSDGSLCGLQADVAIGIPSGNEHEKDGLFIICASHEERLQSGNSFIIQDSVIEDRRFALQFSLSADEIEPEPKEEVRVAGAN
jgi:hypothetical protein